MKSPSLHVRKKVVALLVSMTALWVFAAAVTLREGMNLLFVSTLDTGVGRPTESLIDSLQQERKAAVVALSGGGQRGVLIASRARTDEALASWRSHIADTNLGLAASAQLQAAIRNTSTELDRLSQYRSDVDTASMDRSSAVSAFTKMIDAAFLIYGSISGFDDQDIAKQARTLITLSRARELLSQEDALMSGMLAAGTFTAQDVIDFTKLVGAQRFLYATTAPDLPPEDLVLYEQASNGQGVTKLRELEDITLQKAKAGAASPLTAAAWQEAVGPAVRDLRAMEVAAADHTVARATPAAIWVLLRLLLAGGLGLLAVIAAIIISITTARRLVQQLEKLREAARDLADTRLPDVVHRLSVGQVVDVTTEAPPLSGFGRDEIGQVGQAINAVQETAIRAAVQQADLRRGVRDVFLSLARRTQNLVHKQLRMLDSMERRAGADEMEDLFRIDHLATRMRRNAENLIVLAGATPGRTWRSPVAMIDVVRGALAEVEDYSRVTVLPIDAGALTGRAVGDVIHLLAELIENAVSYSPPHTRVNVSGQIVSNGFVVEIEDRGVGMSDTDVETGNLQLADPPEFNLADASRLGHYVVAKLAQRHGIRIHLRSSPYGGITAIVLIPAVLIDEPVQPRHAIDAAPSIAARHDRSAIQSSGAHELPRSEAAVGVVTIDVPEARPAPSITSSGLPWRIRQANLAPQLKAEASSPSEQDVDTEEQPPRDPEQVRLKMQSYRHGIQRGLADAAGDIAGQSNGGPADHHLPELASREHPGDQQEG